MFRIERGDVSLRVVPPHRHMSYTLGLAMTGAHRVRCRGETVVVAPGEVVFFNPGDNHSALPACTHGWSYSMLHIEEPLIASVTSARGFPALAAGDAAIATTMRKLCAAESSLATEELLIELLQGIFSGQKAQSARMRESVAIQRVCDYIRANMAAPGNLSQLGAIAGLHPNYLLSAFTRQVGMSPHKFLDQVRVSAAQDLILRGEPLSSIAFSVGYSDQSHLSRNFKKLVGVTPGEFRGLYRPLSSPPRSHARARAT